VNVKGLALSFLRCGNGNFGILTAGGVACLAATAGVAIDLNRMIDLKTELQAAADAGALAGVSSMAEKGVGEVAAEKVAADFTREQIGAKGGTSKAAIVSSNVAADAEISTGPGGVKAYEVTVSVSKSFEVSGLTRLIGASTREVSVVANAVNEGSSSPAFSLFMVLDTSGSMADGKLVDLKDAGVELVNTLNNSDLEKTYIRTGGAAFNGKIKDRSDLTFTLKRTREFINDLKQGGATNSTPAMQVAVNQLTSPDDDAAHMQSTKSVNPAKYILFMGDGANTVEGANAKTKALCDEAKAAGIIIYTIGFQMYGESDVLQYCASPGKFWKAKNRDQLMTQFRNIANAALESKPVGSRLRS
jgi:uncharacterized protein YegL/Flp pilus assembly protein TadG